MIVVLAFFAAAAAPSGIPPAAQPKNITVVGQKEKTCRREASTGSVIPKVVCMTSEEREALTERSLTYKENDVRSEDMQLQVQMQRTEPPK
jgi:hypothetical protein